MPSVPLSPFLGLLASPLIEVLVPFLVPAGSVVFPGVRIKQYYVASPIFCLIKLKNSPVSRISHHFTARTGSFGLKPFPHLAGSDGSLGAGIATRINTRVALGEIGEAERE